MYEHPEKIHCFDCSRRCVFKGDLARGSATTSGSEAALHVEEPLRGAVHCLVMRQFSARLTNTEKRKDKWYAQRSPLP